MILLALLSICLMALDQHLDGFLTLKSNLSMVSMPIRYMVHSPIKAWNWLDEALSFQTTLLKDNADLRANEVLLHAKIYELTEMLRLKNQAQHSDYKKRPAGNRFLAAELLAVEVDAFADQVVIDKAKSEGVYIGQPVFDADGVFGQVINVGPMTSLVMLLTDLRSAIPVQIERTGTRAIAVGSGDGHSLTLLHVSDTTDIISGDRLLSSGLGLRYPAGYPVGVVDSIEHLAGQGFALIKARPSAQLRKSRNLLLTWPARGDFLPQVQEQLKKSQRRQDPLADLDVEDRVE